MKNGRRHAIIFDRAYELATSGLHLTPLTIVNQLIREGYHEAELLLSSENVRRDLRELCAEHWQQSAKPQSD